MLRKLVTWLIVWEVSFLASKTGLIEQGMAFIYIYVILDFWYALALAENILRSQAEEGGIVVRRINWILAISMIVASVIKVGLTWTVSTVFQIDFYSAYQILVLGSCLYGNKRNEWANRSKFGIKKK